MNGVWDEGPTYTLPARPREMRHTGELVRLVLCGAACGPPAPEPEQVCWFVELRAVTPRSYGWWVEVEWRAPSYDTEEQARDAAVSQASTLMFLWDWVPP